MKLPGVFMCVISTSLFGATYYVAADGDDSNSGTIVSPFATVQHAVNTLQPGDTVFIRRGVYPQTVSIAQSGTSSTHITIAGYPGEKAVIDGESKLPSSTGSALISVSGSYVTVRDLTVINSHGVGARLQGNYGTLLRIKANHNYTSGLYITGGSYNVIDSCEAYYNSTKNEYGASTSGWGSGISSARGRVNHSILRHNKVWNNWGEGMSTFESRYDTLEDNVVWDNYSTGIYISDTNFSVCQRNLVYTTPGNPLAGYGGSQQGILMGDEVYSSVAPSSNNLIINNLVLGGYRSFNWWGSNSKGGFVNEVVAHNTFVSNATTVAAPFKIARSANSSGSRIENNIIVAEDSTYAVAAVPSGKGLVFSHNLWSNIPPALVSGPGDVIGDPRLAKVGSTAAGDLHPEWFRLLPGSPAIHKAAVSPEVKEDYFGIKRGANPSIGGYEETESIGAAERVRRTPSDPGPVTPRLGRSGSVGVSRHSPAKLYGRDSSAVRKRAGAVGTRDSDGAGGSHLGLEREYPRQQRPRARTSADNALP